MERDKGELIDARQVDRHRALVGSVALTSEEHLGHFDDDIGQYVGSLGSSLS
jgi:hypothetical protein